MFINPAVKNNINWVTNPNINKATDKDLDNVGVSSTDLEENAISDKPDSVDISNGTAQASATASLPTIENSKNPDGRVCIKCAPEPEVVAGLLSGIFGV